MHVPHYPFIIRRVFSALYLGAPSVDGGSTESICPDIDDCTKNNASSNSLYDMVNIYWLNINGLDVSILDHLDLKRPIFEHPYISPRGA